MNPLKLDSILPTKVRYRILLIDDSVKGRNLNFILVNVLLFIF